MRHVLLLLALSSLPPLVGGCSLFEHRTGRAGDQLAPCPSPPRCVNSQASSERHGIEPLQVRGDGLAAWREAATVVGEMPRTTIVESTADYLRAEIVSPWHFYTDDLELLLNADGRKIDVRSTGRIGYYDFGVNRDRVEALRRALAERDVIEP